MFAQLFNDNPRVFFIKLMMNNINEQVARKIRKLNLYITILNTFYK